MITLNKQVSVTMEIWVVKPIQLRTGNINMTHVGTLERWKRENPTNVLLSIEPEDICFV